MKLKVRTAPPWLVGQSFNDLYVRRRTTERQGGHVIYECVCSCGRLARVRATRLTHDIKKSCGQCQGATGVTRSIKFSKDRGFRQ